MRDMHESKLFTNSEWPCCILDIANLLPYILTNFELVQILIRVNESFRNIQPLLLSFDQATRVDEILVNSNARLIIGWTTKEIYMSVSNW